MREDPFVACRAPGSRPGRWRLDARAAPCRGRGQPRLLVIRIWADEKGEVDRRVQWGRPTRRPRVLLRRPVLKRLLLAARASVLRARQKKTAFRLGGVPMRPIPDSTRKSVSPAGDRVRAFRPDRAKPPVVSPLRLALAALRLRRRLALDPGGRQGRYVVFRLAGLRLAGLRLVVLCGLRFGLGLLRFSLGFGRDSLCLGRRALLRRRRRPTLLGSQALPFQLQALRRGPVPSPRFRLRSARPRHARSAGPDR